jgi:hypothetical protein
MTDWGQLTIDPAGLDCERLLQDWRWLVPHGLRAFELTLFGDWFFEDNPGRVLFLDTVAGTLSEIAPTRDAFLRLREARENFEQWYMPDLALLCLERGLRPGPGQCLSFKLPPVLSGSLDPENVEVCDLMVHESITAQIHHGVKDLPEGTRIDRFVVDGEEP